MADNTTRTFFFMATLQLPDPRGIRVLNVWGNVEFNRSVTRQETITWFNETYLPREGLEGANTMFWQCEPNDYPETQRSALRSEPYTAPAPDAG